MSMIRPNAAKIHNLSGVLGKIKLTHYRIFRQEKGGSTYRVFRRNGKLTRMIKTTHFGADGSNDRRSEYIYTEPNKVEEWRLNNDGSRIDVWSVKYALR